MRHIAARPVLTAAIILSVLWIGWTAHRVAHTLPVVYGYWMWNPDEEIRIIAQESLMVVATLLSVGILGEYLRTEPTRRPPDVALCDLRSRHRSISSFGGPGEHLKATHAHTWGFARPRSPSPQIGT